MIEGSVEGEPRGASPLLADATVSLASGLLVFGAVLLGQVPGIEADLLGGQGLSLSGYLLVNAAGVSLLGALLFVGASALLRHGLGLVFACAAMLVNLAACLPTLMGHSAFMERNRWTLLGAVVLVSLVGLLGAERISRRLLATRRAFALGVVAAVGLLAVALFVLFVAFLPHGRLHPGLLLLLGWWSQGALSLLVVLLLARRAPPPRRALWAVGGVLTCLALLDAGGVLDGRGASHLRRIHRFNCPNTDPLVRLGGAARRQWLKVRGRLRSRSALRDRPLPPAPASSKPRNQHHVVLLVVDALRRDRFGEGVTPAIAQLARESQVYPRTSSPAPGTGHSLPAYLTGLPPGVVARLTSRPRSLPALLGQHGYLTASTLATNISQIRVYPLFDGRGMDALGFVRELNVKAPDYRGFDRLQVDAALQLLEAPGPPRLIYVHLLTAHGPFAEAAAYDEAVRSADAEVGRFVSALRQKGLLERTVLAVFADHGEALGEHGMWRHAQALYGEQTDVPLLLRIPGRAGQEHPGALDLTRLPELVMDALGATWPVGGPPRPEALRDVALLELHVFDELLSRSVRDGAYSYHRDRSGDEELYDLRADPGELMDLSHERPEELKRYRTLEAEAARWERELAEALERR